MVITNNKSERVFTGTVVSAKMQKTVVVRVDVGKKHPKYPKRYMVSAKYLVHDERGLAKEGDLVRFTECRPLSAKKRWRLLKILKSNGWAGLNCFLYDSTSQHVKSSR